MSIKSEELQKKIDSSRPINPDYLYGLSEEDVLERRKEGLYNKTPKQVTKSYLRIVLDNVLSFFNIIFFSIAILMLISGIRTPSSYFFLLPLLGNIALGLYADIRARILVDNLRVLSSPKAKVVRSGRLIEIEVDQIVLSDIVLLEAGDQVPCDGSVVEGRLNMDESLLTGEGDTISKKLGSQVLSGSFVKSGRGYIKVEKIGIANYASSLQMEAKKFRRPKSEIKRSCLRIFGTTGTIAIVIGVAMTISDVVRVVMANGSFQYSDFTTLMQSLSGSLVAMIPAGLYLLTSLTLSIGLIHLSEKKMNVQELYCIEILARVDTICLDKTGTLTDGKLSVKDLYNFSDMTDQELGLLIGSAIWGIGDNNPTATALKNRFKDKGLTVTNTIPFDSARKYSAATIENRGTYIFGAVEFVDGAIIPERAEYEIKSLIKRGFRVLGIFYHKKPIKNDEIPSKPTLVGLLSISDHIKEDAPGIIKWFVDNGVTVKIISGDNDITVSEIAREAGVPMAERSCSMVGVRDEEIPDMVEDIAVFGRVSPQQKAIIIDELKKRGHTVAMTGDGVNDILALKTADCSIAMQSGSAAARNVSHMISMDNDFSKLPDVVAEGRRVINNLQRTGALFLSKTFFAIVMSVIFLFVSSFGGPLYPFKTSNMILWELVTIGAGGFFLSLQPTNERLHGQFLKNILFKAIPSGIVEIISAGIPLLVSVIFPDFLSFNVAVSCSIILFSITSYLALFRVCYPFDKYRAILFGLLVLGGIFILLIDYFDVVSFVNMGITFSFEASQWGLIGGTFVAVSLIYVLLTAIFNKILVVGGEDESQRRSA